MSTTIVCQPNEAAEHLGRGSVGPVVFIFQNGSRFAGGEPAAVAELLALLDSEPLRGDQEQFGFIPPDPVGLDEQPLFPPGFVTFNGNFERRSHGFAIATNDAVTIATLTAAIQRNLASEAYRAAKAHAV